MEKSEAIDYLKQVSLAYFATVDEEKISLPKVRPMAIIHHDEKVWAVTITGRKKIDQLRMNNNFEFSAIIPEGEKSIALRANGIVKFIEDMEIKKELSEVISFFSAYWKSFDDPNFVLMHLVLSQLLFQIPSDVVGQPAFYSFELF